MTEGWNMGESFDRSLADDKPDQVPAMEQIKKAMQGRICHALLCSGALNGDGRLPECLGPQCNRYEPCAADIIWSIKEIEGKHRSPEAHHDRS